MGLTKWIIQKRSEKAIQQLCTAFIQEYENTQDDSEMPLFYFLQNFMGNRIRYIERLSEFRTTLYPHLDSSILSPLGEDDLRCVLFCIFCIEDKNFRVSIKQENKIDFHLEIVHKVAFQKASIACPSPYSEVYKTCLDFVKYLQNQNLF